MSRSGSLCFLLTLMGLAHASKARAADTVETWSLGASDVDFYVGYDGMGLRKGERVLYGDMMLGYGLAERFSAYLGSTLEGNDGSWDGASTHYVGIFGTPLDTPHVDLDLFLDISQGGFDNDFMVSPALELNLDADPEMGSWGLYLRTPLPIYGRKLESGEKQSTFHIEGTIGAYAHLAPAHQLLVELDTVYHPDPVEDERKGEVGGIALGYNVTISDSIELIQQLYLDIPQEGDKFNAGLMFGFIATLPSVSSTSTK